MIKRRMLWIVAILVAVLVLSVLYFCVIKPYYDAKNAPAEEVIPELLEGEALVLRNRIALFPQIERAQVEEIEVHNAYGNYTFRHDSSGNFYIEGMEGANLDASMVSQLIVGAGYPITMERLDTSCDHWEEYGLGENNDPVWYRIRAIDGTEHTVQIGSLLLDGSGFYCRYTGRDALYTMSATSVIALLVRGASLVSPTLGYPMNTNDYYTVTDFMLYRTDDPENESVFDHLVTWITYNEKSYESAYAQTNMVYQMIKPGSYIPHSDNYDAVLQLLMQFKGLQTMAAGGSNAPLSDEVLAQYGLDHPKYALHYVYGGKENTIRFSERAEDGTMYAYTSLFNLVALVDGKPLGFLDWDLIDFIDDHIFSINIGEVASIKIKGKQYADTFNMRTVGENLVVVPQSTLQAMDEVQLKNYRQLYMTLLTVYIDGYTTSDATDDELLQVVITTHAGKTFDFRFYGVSTRHCYYTCNGEGEFFVLRDMVEKIENDVGRLQRGEPIDAWGKN